MTDVNTVFSDRGGWGSRWLAPLARQFWMMALIICMGALAVLAYRQMQQPLFEASAVVLVQSGIPAANVAAQVLGRDSLLAIASRHGPSGTNRAATAVELRKDIAINDLTSQAGQTLGYAPQTAGLVVSVRLPDPEVAARIANDLAQQILDDGNSGHFDENQTQLDFYRRDESRLWQEVSAVRAEQDQALAAGTVGAADGALVSQRQLMLMQDQYDLVRHHLAEAEIAIRLARQQQAGQFSLLRRATANGSQSVARDWLPAGLAGSLLLAVALAFVLERRFPTLQSTALAALGGRVVRLYRHFDDPARPILGMPRYLVISVLIVIWLYVAARLFA